MEIKYAYEMTRKAEEVRKEIRGSPGSAETETGNSQHHDEKHDARCPLKGRKAPVPHGNSVYSLP